MARSFSTVCTADVNTLALWGNSLRVKSVGGPGGDWNGEANPLQPHCCELTENRQRSLDVAASPV
jgi:hypothetical protein